ncbi:MAG: hypothetical protein QNJ89_01775 [Acidimicrobiia bacterium]|nr:hypothetical protein [Acidimicrobiia bacterium]
MSDRNEPPTYDEGSDPYEGLVDLTGEEPLPPLEDPNLPPASPPRSPLLTGLILGLLLVVLSIAIFNLTRDDETTAAAEPPGTTEAGESATTEPGETTIPNDETTVDNTSTTTTAAPVVFDPYTAVGNPVPFDDLKLEVGGIGPIRLGAPASEAVGQLIATLGEPTSDTGPVPGTDEFGASCRDTQMRVVTFGALAAVVIVDADGAETFGGYRLDLTYEGAATSASVEIETLSGLKLGYSVVDLRRIYDGFDINLVNDPDLGRIFELRSGNTGNLLLWGPVTDSGNEGTDQIMGIYSVDASAGFC